MTMAAARSAGRRALAAHRLAHQMRDAGARRARAEEDDALAASCAAGMGLAEEAHAGEDAGDDDPRRALDVVVEAGESPAVALEQANGVVLLEVFPLEQGVGEDLLHGLDEGLDEGVVRGPAQARAAVAEVERIVEQGLPIGAHVERDGQGEPGVDARARGVERELAHGDAHAARSPDRRARGCARCR